MEILPTQAKEFTLDILRAGLVPNIVGAPGVGKSDIIRNIAEELNLEVIDVRLAQSDPTDMSGLPTFNEDRSRSTYAPPEQYPLEGDELPEGKQGWLIFFDELTSAPTMVVAAAYKVILDRMVGQQKLHKRVMMVAAGNRIEDKAIVNRMSTAMQSRLIHLEMKVDPNSWLTWATENKIDHRVIGYIGFRPEMLHKFDPNHNDKTFPCPRTWEFMSKLIKKWDKIPYTKMPVLAGTIGQGAAMEFQSFTANYENLPTFQEILANPKGVQISDEPSVLYALSSIISHRITRNNIEACMEMILRLPKEFQVVTLQDILRTDVTLQDMGPIKEWIKENIAQLRW